MEKIISIIIAISISALSFAQEKRRVKPTEYSSRTRIISGKKKAYYPLSARKATTIDVQNTSEVKVYCRARMDKEKGQKTVTIKYHFDDEDFMRFKTLTFSHRTAKALYTDKLLDESPSELKSFDIQIPKGKRTVNVYLKDNNLMTDARFKATVSGKYKNLKPIETTGRKTEMIIGSKRRYYTLSKKKRTLVVTDGPGKLYVYARLKTNKSNKMAIKYVRDQKLVKTLVRDSLKSISSALYTSKEKTDRLSKLQKFVLKIPAGKHEFEFFESNKYSSTDVYFEYIRELPKKWKDVSLPTEKTVQLKSVKTQKPRDYYRVDNEKTISIEVMGPTQIRIMSRVEFEYHMHSNVQATLMVYEGDKQVKAFKFSSKRSKKMEYVSDDDHIPGTLNKMYLEVPEGKHTYKLKVDNGGKSVLTRFSEPDTTPTKKK